MTTKYGQDLSKIVPATIKMEKSAEQLTAWLWVKMRFIIAKLNNIDQGSAAGGACATLGAFSDAELRGTKTKRGKKIIIGH